jgi:hypothetical protein
VGRKGFVPRLDETSDCAFEGTAASNASTPNAARVTRMVQRTTKPERFVQDEISPSEISLP